jgi:telomerase reverse transcriptase
MPPNLKPASSQHKISLSDLKKRKEIFFEFIYYLFTSILIPLIRGNFYVTESQLHRNRLFYFRHDVWRRITTRPLANIKSSMFEELNIDEAKKILSNRKLGYGSLRLLPKSTSIRPILNLKLRPIMTTARAGRRQQKLGYSVNSTIAPIHGMLDFERRRRDHLLGSGINSVGDIHLRLKAFKESLVAKGWNKDTPLYFVKVDIQSCFDTIPQQNLVRLVETLIPEETYHYVNYVTVRPGNEFASMWPQGSDKCKTLRRFLGRATATSEHLTDSIANGSVPGRRNTVFVDTVKQHKHSSAALLDLLDAHVRSNLVRIGKKYFRQRNGIPQGSVISSLLCNLFYAEMERDVLGFLQPDNATVLLLRLIDDFLLVTPDSEVAMRFLRVMLKGQPAYGISVNPAKSLVNFAASIDGAQIPRLVDTTLFPYCGSLVDTQTLEIFKDQDRILDGAESVTAALTNSLSIEPSRAPGRSFHRKALASIKLTMHPMYLDTAHNSQSAVLSNLYSTMVTAAMKMYRYTRSLPNLAHPRPEVVVRTIHDVIQLGYRMVRGQHGLCAATIQYLGAAAFHLVLGRKQTRYASVLRWLDGMTEEARQSLAGNGVLLLLAQVVRKGNVTYGGWRF